MNTRTKNFQNPQLKSQREFPSLSLQTKPKYINNGRIHLTRKRIIRSRYRLHTVAILDITPE